MKRNGSSITRTFVIVYTALIVLPVLLIILVLNAWYSSALTDDALKNQSQTLEKISTGIQNEIQRQSIVAYNICADYITLSLLNKWVGAQGMELYTAGLDINGRISQPALLLNDYQSVAFYFQKSGKVFSYGSRPYIAAEALRGQSLYKKAMEQKGSLTVQLLPPDSDGRNLVAYAISPDTYISNNKVELAYMSFGVSFVRDYGLNGDGYLILDGDGAIIFSYKNPCLHSGYIFAIM